MTQLQSRAAQRVSAAFRGAALILALLSPLTVSGQVTASSEEEERGLRAAFIRAAMEEQQEQVRKQLAEMAERGIYPLMIVTTLRPFADWDYYFVEGGEIVWQPNPGQTFEKVVVPPGFVTDLTSIPRLFWQILRPEGRYAYAAVVHDYLYWTQKRPREEADQIFKIAMEDSKVDPVKVAAIYEAVRRLGQSAWDENARLRQGGERRMLKRFPEEFTTSWNDWKKQPGVFEEE